MNKQNQTQSHEVKKRKDLLDFLCLGKRMGKSDQRKSTTATIIYLDNGRMLISKKNYQNWREIQKEYGDNYKTSLSPMTNEEIISFFMNDFKKESHWPFSKREIIRFFNSESEIIQSNKDN